MPLEGLDPARSQLLDRLLPVVRLSANHFLGLLKQQGGRLSFGFGEWITRVRFGREQFRQPADGQHFDFGKHASFKPLDQVHAKDKDQRQSQCESRRAERDAEAFSYQIKRLCELLRVEVLDRLRDADDRS